MVPESYVVNFCPTQRIFFVPLRGWSSMGWSIWISSWRSDRLTSDQVWCQWDGKVVNFCPTQRVVVCCCIWSSCLFSCVIILFLFLIGFYAAYVWTNIRHNLSWILCAYGCCESNFKVSTSLWTHGFWWRYYRKMYHILKHNHQFWLELHGYWYLGNGIVLSLLLIYVII